MDLAIAVVGVLVAIVAIYVGWWAPKAERMREKLREAEPTLYFTVGSYGGPSGYGFGLNLQNQGGVAAYDLTLYLPGREGPALRINELPPGATPYEQVPIADDASIRTHPTEGLVARLVYHDRYGREFVASLGLLQQPRADGRYNLGPDPQGPSLIRPTTRFTDLWRLRKDV